MTAIGIWIRGTAPFTKNSIHTRVHAHTHTHTCTHTHTHMHTHARTHTNTHTHTHTCSCALFHVRRKVKLREREINLTTNLAGKESIKSESLQVDAKNLKNWRAKCSKHPHKQHSQKESMFQLPGMKISFSPSDVPNCI